MFGHSNDKLILALQKFSFIVRMWFGERDFEDLETILIFNFKILAETKLALHWHYRHHGGSWRPFQEEKG